MAGSAFACCQSTVVKLDDRLSYLAHEKGCPNGR